MEKAFQYNTLTHEVGKDDEQFWEKLSSFGLEGWEVVSVLTENTLMQTKRIYVLKRERNRTDLEEERRERYSPK